MKNIPGIDTLPPAEIKKLQEEKLRNLLVYIEKKSPFYKELFLKNRIDISGIKTFEDLKNIPTTSKDILQERNSDFLCVDRTEIAEYCSTSGSMGLPLTIALTEKDLERLAYNVYLSFLCADSKPSDIFQLMLTLDRQFMAGIAYYAGARRLGAGIVRTGPGNLGMQIDCIARLGSNVLIAVPSYIISLINYAEEKKISLNETSVRAVICIGENIREEDFSLNELGKRIVKNWNVQLYSTFASTEMQTAFTECSFGNGGHHHPELLLFEILDENNNQLPAGEYGELTITTLGVEGMPLLRYKTGDICTYHDKPCACGRNSVRISPIKARKQQLIKYNGTTLYPQSIFNMLNSIEDIEDYVVQIFNTEIGTDDMMINIALRNSGAETENKIKQSLQSALKVTPKIKYMPLAEINRMQQLDIKRKANRLIDTR